MAPDGGLGVLRTIPLWQAGCPLLPYIFQPLPHKHLLDITLSHVDILLASLRKHNSHCADCFIQFVRWHLQVFWWRHVIPTSINLQVYIYHLNCKTACDYSQLLAYCYLWVKQLVAAFGSCAIFGWVCGVDYFTLEHWRKTTACAQVVELFDVWASIDIRVSIHAPPVSAIASTQDIIWNLRWFDCGSAENLPIPLLTRNVGQVMIGDKARDKFSNPLWYTWIIVSHAHLFTSLYQW